jgi:hypothetical protein
MSVPGMLGMITGLWNTTHAMMVYDCNNQGKLLEVYSLLPQMGIKR